VTFDAVDNNNDDLDDETATKSDLHISPPGRNKNHGVLREIVRVVAPLRYAYNYNERSGSHTTYFGISARS